LDPYSGCLHSGSPRHAALVSDLLEEFRAPLVDALVLGLIARRQFRADRDVEWRDGGCFLNESGRRIDLEGFVARMEEEVETDALGSVPRWEWLSRQVRAFRQFVYSPAGGYQPLRLRT
jgi:CRISPR-associated protein Cas1